MLGVVAALTEDWLAILPKLSLPTVALSQSYELEVSVNVSWVRCTTTALQNVDKNCVLSAVQW